MTLEPCSCGQPAVCKPWGKVWVTSCADGVCKIWNEIMRPTQEESCAVWNRYRRLERLADAKVREWANGRPYSLDTCIFVNNGVIAEGTVEAVAGGLYECFKLVAEEK